MPTPAAWPEAVLAAALLAVDPRVGGVAVRGLPGPVRDRYLALLRRTLPAGAPWRRIPLHAADDRLLGGLDLAATLRAGCPVASRGLLAEADGGLVLLAMAERVAPGVAARLGAALDTGAVVVEREGLALRSAARFGVVALDEGLTADERPPAALLDRLAFLVELDGIGLQDVTAEAPDAGQIQAARTLLPQVELPDALLEVLCGTAAALGVGSMRSLLLALRVARAAAALAGRTTVLPEDAAAAARLVLAPRATMAPAAPEDGDAPVEDAPPGDPPPDGPASAAAPPANQPDGPAPSPEPGPGEPAQDPRPLGEIVLQAARAAMPAGLLAQLLAGQKTTARAAPAGAGALQQAARRGRPIGTRRGALQGGARLNLIATLRAAAPWQTLRHRTQPPGAAPRVLVLQDDIRITRFRQRTETTTIFLVDASGSAALNRLAEAKGAVELVLADCYVRRDRVALIAFRGAAAETLLPPTASLVRAKRSLAGLPGGGGTPLAAGLDAGTALAAAIRRRGQSAVVILLSDGRANVARGGVPGRPQAEADALAAGRALRASGVASLLVDTAPRPAPQARQLAVAMGARYLPLPYADAAALARAVRSSPHG